MTVAEQPRSCNGTDALSSDSRIPWFEIPLCDRPTMPLTLSLSPQGRGDACTDLGSRMKKATGCAPSPIEGKGILSVVVFTPSFTGRNR
jgi:hypothetical protein